MNKMFLATVMCFSFITTTFAASNEVELRGVVPRKLSLVAQPDAAASALDLEQGVIRLKVGTITEQSNSNIGYVVTVYSKNKSYLKRDDSPDSEHGVLYQLEYGEKEANVTAAEGHRFEREFSGVVNVDKEVRITYAANPALVAGNYSDTLYFSISAN